MDLRRKVITALALCEAAIAYYAFTQRKPLGEPVEQESTEDVPVNPTSAMLAFRGAYGRLCTLTCKALRTGELPREMILEAFEGAGSSTHPTLLLIRDAWVAQDHLYRRVTHEDGAKAVQEMASQAAHAVGNEWFIEAGELQEAFGVGG